MAIVVAGNQTCSRNGIREGNDCQIRLSLSNRSHGSKLAVCDSTCVGAGVTSRHLTQFRYTIKSVTIQKTVEELVMYLIKIIKNWYRGKYIEGKCISHMKDDFPTQNDHHNNVPLLTIETDYYKQPLLAKALKHISRYCAKHYMWLITTTIALTALILALL